MHTPCIDRGRCGFPSLRTWLRGVPGGGQTLLQAQCVEAGERKDYDSAITLGQKALAAAEKAVGPDAMVIEGIVRVLGVNYVARGALARPFSEARHHADLSKARIYLRRPVGIRERWLGPDHEPTKSLRAAVIRLLGTSAFED